MCLQRWLRLLSVDRITRVLRQRRECHGLSLRREMWSRWSSLLLHPLHVRLIVGLKLLHRVILLSILLVNLCLCSFGSRWCPLLHHSRIELTAWCDRCRRTHKPLLLIQLTRRLHYARLQLLKTVLQWPAAVYRVAACCCCLLLCWRCSLLQGLLQDLMCRLIEYLLKGLYLERVAIAPRNSWSAITKGKRLQCLP